MLFFSLTSPPPPPALPTSGHAAIDGCDVVSDRKRVRERMGYCPQADPLIGQLVSAAVGVDIGAAANRVALSVNDTIWTEIGREEAAIRADPQSTNDPVLIGALGVGSRL